MEDLIGKRFGKLTVIKYSHKDKKSNTYWLCKCDCGGENIVRRNHLLSGGVKSCGCVIYEKREVTHGLYSRNPRLNKIYDGMIDRCYKTYRNCYKNYGARGIRVCDEWLNNPKKFEEWALKNGYQEKLTIDRIDVNGSYEPNNCRWVDNKTQCRNKRNNRYITYNGETRCLSEWCELYNFTESAVRHWVERRKISWEDGIKHYIERVGK